MPQVQKTPRTHNATPDIATTGARQAAAPHTRTWTCQSVFIERVSELRNSVDQYYICMLPLCLYKLWLYQ